MGARRLLAALGAILGLALHDSAAAVPREREEALNRAASLYHQAAYDSARSRMEALLAEPGWRRRDSLMLYQYLGMASSRLGSDGAAVSRFDKLLELDSLFQFPRNEDPAILRNFETARQAKSRAGQAPPSASGTQPAPDPARAAGQAAGPAPAADPGPPGNAEMIGPAAAGLPGLGAAAPEDPLRALASQPSRPPMNLALGAVPLGGGWLIRGRRTQALALGLLQGGGMILSLYASEQQSRLRNDRWGREEGPELDRMVRWQWVQAISLSTALGAYLFSIFASGGD